jgi:hypothetical protein
LPRGFRDVDPEEFKKVPYLSHIPRDGRIVFLQPFVDKTDGKWKQFIPQENKLTWILSKPVECLYFSEVNAYPNQDIYLKLADVVTRHYSYPDAISILLQIVNKIVFSAVVVEKYFLSLMRYRITKDVLVSDIVATDVEYLFANVRSVYDLIQKLFSKLWEDRSGVKMKGSFRKIVQKPEDYMRSQYKLPDPMIGYYSASKSHFSKIRAIRDAIFHPPAEVTMQLTRVIFSDDDGFALMRNELFPNSLSLSFDIWPQDKTKPNGLVSVLALLSYVNKMLLNECDRFSDALLLTIPPPPPVTDSHKLFLASPYVHHHIKADKYLEEQWVKADLVSRLTQNRGD